MLNGQEKAQALLAMLQDNIKDVLTHLSPESAKLLTSSIDDAPDMDDATKSQLISEVIEKIDGIQGRNNFQSVGANDLSGDPFAASGDGFDLSSDGMSPFDTGSLPEPSESVSHDLPQEPQAPKPSFNAGDLAEVIQAQSPQIAAFVLHQMDPSMRSQVEDHIADDVLTAIKAQSVESIPLSKKVFDNLYDSILKEAKNLKGSGDSMSMESDDTGSSLDDSELAAMESTAAFDTSSDPFEGGPSAYDLPESNPMLADSSAGIEDSPETEAGYLPQ